MQGLQGDLPMFVVIIAAVFFLGLIVLVQGAGELIGPEGMTALIYILAGAKN